MDEALRERITHVCFACFYVDGLSYQENLLPRFHKRAGSPVQIITSLVTFDENGAVTECPGPSEYLNEDEIPVQRLGYRRLPFARRTRIYQGTYRAIAQSRPDVLFIHGPQFMDAIVVARYLKRHPEVRAYVDSHADFGNSASTRASRLLLHGVLWKSCAKLLERHARKFYGVLPARVDFLSNVYGVSRAKTQLLIMGADDDLVARSRSRTRESLRSEYHLPSDRFLVATGGKVNEYRPEVLELLESVQDPSSPFDVVIFGNASSEYRARYESLLKCPRVHHLGWLAAQQSLDVMACADVVIFPGKHSVLWEQAVAVGAPLIVRKLPGVDHVDLGGNCLYLSRADEDEIRQTVQSLIEDPDVLAGMKKIAESPPREEFLYGNIAEESLK